jgi:hypothetical protein
MILDGFQLTSLQSDDRFLSAAAKDEIEAVRAGVRVRQELQAQASRPANERDLGDGPVQPSQTH